MKTTPKIGSAAIPSLHYSKEGWPRREILAKRLADARPGWFSDSERKENHPGCGSLW